MIIFVSIIVTLLAVAGAAMLFLSGYNDDVAKTEGDLVNLALTLNEKADEALQAVDSYERDLIAQIPPESLKPDEFDKFCDSQQAAAALTAASQALAYVLSFEMINAKGRVVGSSYPLPKGDLVFAKDKTYFQVLSSDSSLTLFLSEPIRNKATGKTAITLARSIRNAEGSFLGLISAHIDLEHFDTMFKDHTTSPSMAVSLYRQDGILLARTPTSERALGKPIATPKSPLRRMIAHNSQTLIRDISQIDKKERLFAIHPLAHFPAGVAVSETVSQIMSGHRVESYFVRFLGVIMDITIGIVGILGVRQVKTSVLRAASEGYLARHDLTTKLPNRLLFIEALRRASATFAKSRTDFALLFIDIDQFKDLNANFGHMAGDQIIQTIARRLRGRLNKTDFIARVGGDEFAIIQRPVKSRQQIVDLAAAIQNAMKIPCAIDDAQIDVTVSIGIAVASAHGRSSTDLIKAADLALYAAKSDSDSRYRFFDSEIKDKRAVRRALESDLKKALEKKELELYYQPILDLRSGQLWGFEALLRWKHPVKGMIPPLEFISLAEESGLIGPIGDWILEDACTTAMSWTKPLRVSINLSPVQFKRRDVFTSVKQALSVSGLPAERVALEITESVQLTEEATTTLKKLKSLGASISLDDFGTGYASMSYLRSFPFDKIKIDQSFVRGMDAPDNRAIIKATIALANDLNMTTTAEGVETVEQLRALRQAGASQAQGYLIAKPMSREATASFIENAKLDFDVRPEGPPQLRLVQ